MGARRTGGPVVRTVAVTVTAAALLTSCGRLQAKQHPFPEAVGKPSAAPRTSAPATPRGSASPVPTGSLPPDRLAELPADELLKRAKEAAKKVKTAHATARQAQSGKGISYDLRVDLRTQDFTGSMDIDGAHAELRRSGVDLWIKADAEFWATANAPAKVAEALDGKFVHVPEGAPGFSDMATAVDLGDPSLVLEGFRPTETLPVRTLGGETVIPVRGRSGKSTVTLMLSVSGGLTPVRMEDGAGNFMEYREIDVAIRVSAPSGPVVEVPAGSGVHLPGV